MRTSFVFAVGMLGLALSQGQVQAQTGKKGSLDLNAQVQFSDTWTKTNADLYKVSKIVLTPRDKAKIPESYLSITGLTTAYYHFPPGTPGTSGSGPRQPEKMVITATFHNYNKKPSANGVFYYFQVWNGNHWADLGRGTLKPIAGNQSGTAATLDLLYSRVDRTIRFTLDASVEGRKQIFVPADVVK